MTFRELILSHISANPGCTPRDIHQRFLSYSLNSVERHARELSQQGIVWREKVGKDYRYALADAEMPKSVLTKKEQKLRELDEKVRYLLDMGFNRRAGTLCLELIDLSGTDSQRQYYTSLRAKCLRHRAVREDA